MSTSALQSVIRNKPLLVTLIAALILVLFDAIFTSWNPWENFAEQGNDDIMRLTLVRDLIAGQGWFDVVQYRVIPPEGISIHWSRYIDAGIAAIIIPLSFFMPMPTAEVVGAAIWPVLIMVINILIIGFGTRRIFGAHAACFAVLVTVLWPVTGDLHSGSGNLDHHNIQMFTMTVMGLGMIWPSRPYLAGAIAGIAAAFSLAIGLETLLFVVGAGFTLLIRTVIADTPAARKLLTAFCVALGVGGTLFWLGQAPPVTRMMPICDQLGTPILSVIWIAVIATLAPLVLLRGAASPLVHLGITGGLTTIGIFFAWSLLTPCFAGPYAQLPQDLQDFISTRITEAMPGLLFAQRRPEATIQFILPVFYTTALGLWYVFGNRKSGNETPERNAALAVLIGLCLVGIGMIFIQIRTTIMAASIVPIVAGYLLARQFNKYIAGRDPVAALVGLISAVAIISPAVISSAMKPLLPESAGTALGASASCRSYEAVIALNEAPAGVILNHFNFGPSILWATHHDILSAGYHRSAASMTNSIMPFRLDESDLQEYITEAGADYFLLCRNYDYQSDFVTSLAADEAVPWLSPVVLSDDNLVLLEVIKQ